MTPHKHADIIKAWADGAEIQHRLDNRDEWYTIPVAGKTQCAPAFKPEWEYRIKPQTIRYRNFLWNPSCGWDKGRKVICVCSEQEQLDQPRDQWAGFIKWLGDWQEVEV